MLKRIRNYFLPILTLLSFCYQGQGQAPSPYQNPLINYVRTWQATGPETNSANLTTSVTLDKAVMISQYFDGIGRPWQIVTKQGSLTTGSNPVDKVEAHFYNGRGLEEYKYLPFAANTYNNTSVSDGMFKSNPFEQQQYFSQSQYPGESYYYSHTKYEPSPLGRSLESYAPGDSWVGTENSTKHGTRVIYSTNTTTDDIKTWGITTGPLYNFQVSITNNGNGQQNVVYSWNPISNAGTVLLMYRTLPSGTWNTNAGSPVSPRSWVIPGGTYEYAIQIYFNNGNPPQTVVYGSGSVTNYTVNSSYAQGQLSKIISQDERGNQSIEFKDNEGNIILKKVQLTAQPDNGPGSGYSGWLCTYYIYDDLSHLRCIIQPKGVEAISANWTLDATTKAELCFLYEYDKRGRMISKQIPGAQIQYFIYDKRDRLVMTQDGNQRAQGKWLVTLYDEQNRMVQKGLWNDNHDFNYHLSQADLSSNYYYPFNVATVPAFPDWDMLSSTHYEDYEGLPSDLSSNFITTWNSSLQPASNVWPYPQTPSQSFIVHNKIAYTQMKVLNSNPVQYLASVNIYDHKGHVVQVQSRNTSNAIDVVTTQYTWTGQPLVVIEKHQNGLSNGQTHTVTDTYTYDLLARLVSLNKSVNSIISGVAVSTPSITVVQNKYDALGQLNLRKLGQKKDANGNYTASELTSVSYEYNIRGWIKGINKDYLNNAANSAYFGMELNYDKDGYAVVGQKQYNGNIASVVWRSQGDAERRKYEFSYDPVNRLMKADFSQLENTWTNANVNFDVKVGDGSNPISAYDYNGNIQGLQQWGLLLNTSAQIDNLHYAYINFGNKLKWVLEDAILSNRLGDFKESAQNKTDNINGSPDYGYDKNGNLVSDLNKKLNGTTGVDVSTGGAISYNFLNLPEKIFFKNDNLTDKGNIEYVYDALGTKIKKIVTENISMSTSQYTYTGTVTTTTAYFGAFVYESKKYTPTHPDQVNYADYTDRLKFISMEEGRIRYELANPYTCLASTNRFVFDYYIKDHLGSIRSVLTDQVESICYPRASIEPSTIETEKRLYDIKDPSQVKTLYNANIPAYYSNYFDTQVYETNGSSGLGKKTGLGITLKVMAGDQVLVSAQSYYDKPASSSDYNGGIPLTELLNSFVGSNVVLGKNAVSATDVYNIPNNSWQIDNFKNPTTQNNTANAFVNYILFDEQMHFLTGYSDPVAPGSGTGLYKNHVLPPIPVLKNGYLFVFVSNESNYPVYFDNLAVTHIPGPILEETHYYPHGMVMTGISSKAAYAVENKFRFNGKELQNKEFTDGTGLEWQDFGARMYDEQIGRWNHIDNKAELYYGTSPFVYALNQPTNAIDPDGHLVIFINGNHFGDGGKPEYWRQYRTERVKVREIPMFDEFGVRIGTQPIYHYYKVQTYAFDTKFMDSFHDHNESFSKTSLDTYKDGSLGGWGLGTNSALRFIDGYGEGLKDAATIIANLARDKNGNITESIKVVAHSMGGAYAKGYISALILYVNAHPEQCNGLKITEYDFAIYQPGEQEAVDGVSTFQFVNKGDKVNRWYLGSSNEKEKGASSYKQGEGGHSIFDFKWFFDNQGNLVEGTYIWDSTQQKFVRQQ